MRQGFVVAPSAVAVAGPKLAAEGDVLGRLHSALAGLLAEAGEQLAGTSSGAALDDVRLASGSASTALTGAVLRLAASFVGAARTYADVDALVVAAERRAA